MSQKLIKLIEKRSYKSDRPKISVGDTVVVHTKIRDGEKVRIQKFQGLIIAIKGTGTNKSFTVRKISYGIGVEKIFPYHSTNIDKIEVLKHAKVRRSKLYYLRDRVGKAAMKLKPGAPVVIENLFEIQEEQGEAVETQVSNESEEITEAEVKNPQIEKQKNENSQEEKKVEIEEKQDNVKEEATTEEKKDK